EVEGGSFATPERRAALEARIVELANAVRDEVVRKYYRQDFSARLQRMFAPQAAGGPAGASRNFTPRGGVYSGGGARMNQRPGQGGRGGKGDRPQPGNLLARGPYQIASPQFAASPLMRGQR